MNLSSLFVEQVVGGRLAGWSLSRLAQRRLRERAVLKNGVYVLRFGHGFRVIGAVITGFVIGMWLLFLVAGFRMVPDAEVCSSCIFDFWIVDWGNEPFGRFRKSNETYCERHRSPSPFRNQKVDAVVGDRGHIV